MASTNNEQEMVPISVVTGVRREEGMPRGGSAGDDTSVPIETTGGGDGLIEATVASKEAKSHRRNESKIILEVVDNPTPTDDDARLASFVPIPLSDGPDSSEEDNSNVNRENIQQERRVEFSEERDAPEATTRPYNFDNMVKTRTLPRVQNNRLARGIIRFCASQPRNHLVAWIIMTVFVVICAIILIIFLS